MSNTITRGPGQTFASVCAGPATGLTGTINVRIEDLDNNTLFGPSTAGIEEVGDRIYICTTLVAPTTAGAYLVIWNDGTADGEDVDLLTVTYSAPSNPQDVCSIADVDLELGKDAAKFTDAEKVAAILVAVSAFEKEAAQVFSIRQTTETRRVRRWGDPLTLSNGDVISVDAIGDYTGDLAELDIDDDEILGHWSPGRYEITYTHGLATPPADVVRACALIAASILADGPFDDRGYAIDDGTGLMRLLTAGVGNTAFSIPDVEAALHRHRNPWAGGT